MLAAVRRQVITREIFHTSFVARTMTTLFHPLHARPLEPTSDYRSIYNEKCHVTRQMGRSLDAKACRFFATVPNPPRNNSTSIDPETYSTEALRFIEHVAVSLEISLTLTRNLNLFFRRPTSFLFSISLTSPFLPLTASSSLIGMS